MNSLSIIQRQHQHRGWVTENLLAATGSLSEEQLRRSLAIGQGSIWKSLTHMYAAEYVWLEALEGNETGLTPGDLPGRLPGNQEGESALQSLEELRAAWTTLAERWNAYLATLTEEALDEAVYRVAGSTGQRLSTSRCDVLLHVAMHAHYTAAQVVNMLRQVGAEKFPDTMMIVMARQEGAAK